MATPRNRNSDKDPREQLKGLFAPSNSNQEVGDWRITEEFFASDFARMYRPETAAERGLTIRNVIWRLIEAHNDEFMQHPNTARPAKCSYEKCAECATLPDWHILILLYCWDDKAGIQRQRSIADLYPIGMRAAAWHAALQREQSRRAARSRRYPDDPLYNDPVVRRGLSDSTYKKAKHVALDALYAHLIDPDDPVVLEVLREMAGPTDPPAPAPTLTPTRTVRFAQVVAPAPPAPARVLTLPDGATTLPTGPREAESFPTRMTGPLGAPGAPNPQPDAPAVSAGPPEPLWDFSPTLPRHDATTLPRLPHAVWSRFSWRRWAAVAAIASVLLTCLLTTGAPLRTATLTWTAANLSGWLVARQSIAREPRILAVVNLRTGAWHSLWPPERVVAGQRLTATDALTAPAFTPTGRRLAFIANDSNQVAAIYEVSLMIGANGWPEVAGAEPRMLVECACSTVTWSPSGEWLIYNSPHGLMAIDKDGINPRVLTANKLDAFPACSPDGRYLAYQSQRGGIVVLPTHDCLPDTDSAQHMRYLNGYSTAWNPSWSPDSQMLSFVSNVAGRSTIYVTPHANLTEQPILLIRDTAQPVSASGCGNPVWVQRSGPADTGEASAIVFGCDQPAADDHHGTLGASSGLAWPRWNTSLSEGIMNRDSLCWIPANLQA